MEETLEMREQIFAEVIDFGKEISKKNDIARLPTLIISRLVTEEDEIGERSITQTIVNASNNDLARMIVKVIDGSNIEDLVMNILLRDKLEKLECIAGAVKERREHGAS